MLGYLRPEKFRVGIVLESSELASSSKVQSSHRPLRFHFDHRPRLGAPRRFALLRAASRCFALPCGGMGCGFWGRVWPACRCFARFVSRLLYVLTGRTVLTTRNVVGVLDLGEGI